MTPPIGIRTPRVGWRLVLALGLSLLLHVLLLVNPEFHLAPPPPPMSKPLEIQARLLHPKPPRPPIPQPKREPAAPPKAKPQLLRPPPKPRATQPIAPDHPPADAPAPETAAAPTNATEAPRPAPPASNVSAPTADTVPAPPPDPLPAKAEIRYDLYKGSQGLKVGQVIHQWERRGDSYAITSVAQATGIFTLFKSGRYVQTSQGKITAQGLQPSLFWIQRGQAVDTTESARFDWEAHTLTYGSYQDARTVPLPTGAQDLLSFAYQFAFAAPLQGDLHLYITNGRKLDSYDYRVVGQETVQTPMGPLQALHLTKIHAPGEDGTDIWLGMDYDYLPVKVVLTDKEGDTAEQVINGITMEKAEK